jgi:hypothetical protein
MADLGQMFLPGESLNRASTAAKHHLTPQNLDNQTGASEIQP